MSIEATLYATLNDDATLTTLVADRIYPMRADKNAATPYITYQVIIGVSHNKLIGAPDTERKVIQVNCVSNSYDNAKAIAVACKAAVNGTVGHLTSERDADFPGIDKDSVQLDFALIG